MVVVVPRSAASRVSEIISSVDTEAFVNWGETNALSAPRIQVLGG
jgi:hypothetical protein